jgi:hypothetical protein
VDVIELEKIVLGGTGIPLAAGFFGLSYINTANKEKNDNFEKLLTNAQAVNEKKSD